MSDLEMLAVQLRELADDTHRFTDTVHHASQRIRGLEQDASDLRASDVDVRWLVERLHIANRESSTAISAIQALRIDINRFADGMAASISEHTEPTMRSRIGEALIAAETVRLFLTPGAVAFDTPMMTDDTDHAVAARLIGIAEEQLVNTDDLTSLREAMDDPAVRPRRARDNDRFHH